jgi:hypothetical protein
MTKDYDAEARAEDQRKRDVLAYGHAVATERATYAAACAWHAFSPSQIAAANESVRDISSGLTVWTYERRDTSLPTLVCGSSPSVW